MYCLPRIIASGAAVIGVASLVFASAVAGQEDVSTTDATPAYYTQEQAARGENAYLTNCSGCHGYNMIDTFASYGDADDFHSVISLTMPWEDPGMLPDQFYIDMVAYMLRENGFPAGDTELAIDRDLLRSIDPGTMADR